MITVNKRITQSNKCKSGIWYWLEWNGVQVGAWATSLANLMRNNHDMIAQAKASRVEIYIAEGVA